MILQSNIEISDQYMANNEDDDQLKMDDISINSKTLSIELKKIQTHVEIS